MSQSSLPARATVLIVEDDPVTLRALSLAVESEPALKLEAGLTNVKAAVDWLAAHDVDILLTDLGLPDGSGLDVIRMCTERRPKCEILVITMSSDEANVLACIEAGAAGYILKDSGRLDVVRAIMDLRAGGAPVSPAIARMVLARMRQGKRPEQPRTIKHVGAPTLTKREAAILDLIARGDTYGEVAQLLSVSVGTVQTHIKNIYGKLSVHSRGEAVFEAHRRGLLQFGAQPAKT